MNVNLKKNGALLGFPMLLPLTWEEHVAANMTDIPAFEFFPGAMVSDMYTAYQQGLSTGNISAWDPNNPSDYVVGYISDNAGKPADVVRNFLDALVKTIAAGQAPADALTGKAALGSDIVASVDSVVASAEKTVSNVASDVSAPLTSLAVMGVCVLLLYGLIVFVPKPKQA